MGHEEAAAAVPVETATVERRDISSFIETHGTLEAENEVDLVGRVSAPIVELAAEEGMAVRRGQLLARLDDAELKAQLEISRVALAEAQQAWERAKRLNDSQLISPEEYEQDRTRFETARAQLEGDQIQIGYTEVRAPFSGLIVARYVDFAEQISPGTPMFRLSDFTPLLCPIQVPERDLSRLEIGQSSYLEVESWPGERFGAEVLRIRPVVDAATGTVRVTLAVEGRGKLRPGMFADVFVETDRRQGTLVMPKAALSVDSIGDTVYVASEGVANRREVELGFAEGDFVEAVSGLEAGEQVVVVGQDGLSDGTPIQVLSDGGAAPPQAAAGGMRGPPPGFDPSNMTPEMLEQIKERMRARGLTDEQIEERLKRMRERQGGSG
jgi:membrane fusion protein (multidrug efflux system)